MEGGGGRGGEGGGVGGVGSLPCRKMDRRDPPRHRFAAPPSDWGGSPIAQGGGGGGGVTKFCMGGRFGLGGRRPDPGLLVPDASRQEAEANVHISSQVFATNEKPSITCLKAVRFWEGATRAAPGHPLLHLAMLLEARRTLTSWSWWVHS